MYKLIIALLLCSHCAFGQSVLPSIQLEDANAQYDTPSRFDKVYVVGEIERTQSVTWYEDMRLMDAVAECGGFKKIRVKKDRVYLWRDNTRYIIDLERYFDGDPQANVLLKRGDTIILERNMFAKVSDVLRTVLSPITDVFSGAMGFAATQAIK